jgi:hypothetical protein
MLRACPIQRWLAAALLACAVACGGAPSRGPLVYETGRRAAVTADGLHRVKSYRISGAYLRPGVSFAPYRRLLVAPVEISYKNPPQTPPLGGGRGNFPLPDLDLERLRTAFQQALESELAESRDFEVVDAPGPDVLQVNARIADLVVNTPPQRGRERVYMVEVGEMTGVLDLADSESMELLGRLAERTTLRPQGGTGGLYGPSLADASDARLLFRHWARLLREGLEELVRAGVIPEPDA